MHVQGSRWRAAIGFGLVAVSLVFGVWVMSPETPDGQVAVVLAVAAGAAFVITGVLLRNELAQRGTAVLFIAAGFVRLANDLGVRPYGLLPAIGWLSRPVDELIIMVILLRYPFERIDGIWPRRFVAVSVPVVLTLHVVSGLTFDADWWDFPHPFYWPTVVALPGLQPWIWRGFISAALITAAIVGVLAVRRFRRSSGLLRRELRPVLTAAAAAATGTVLTQAFSLVIGSDTWPKPVYIANSSVFLLIPLAFLVAAVRRMLDRATVADIVVSVPQPATVEAVRAALSRALADPDLRVRLWSPETDSYSIVAGPADPPTDPQRLATEIRDAHGGPLAVIETDPTVRLRPDLLDTAVGAATLGLENARLHADLLARFHELEESRTRIVEAGIAQRRQVERDLHDGAQQQLLALAATIGRAHATATEPAMQDLMDQARREIRKTLRDLRDLARGIHPAVLEHIGLAAAVEAIAEAMPVPIAVRVTVERLPAALEATAYFVICEALTNVVKHANATGATVTVDVRAATVHIGIEDDGIGGTTIRAHGGLAGLRDRVAAFHGTLDIISPYDAGTHVVVELPCDS